MTININLIAVINTMRIQDIENVPHRVQENILQSLGLIIPIHTTIIHASQLTLVELKAGCFINGVLISVTSIAEK
ncbi:hypothetical protein G9C98_000427 [Cotesia typhae]|uniref:Uncharacterized protein n=1 Tax=Cotesia typhae TaxID=2053667 RepID=A0A8J5R6B9_9HYME|nr:hypothetical protein G9C98_000427 [Cotesia typhae]